ncbi:MULTISPECIES: hypothetical protein [unclassified Serratia (in: enterobacteria)]|uniref:hypothetical protein n=1 Tax=unclassified Serratia (in: enterobacteria) TaxID=2647522 RepID=UPI002ED650E3|nr:hypothetical protein [Serratia sp. C2(2)]MEE4449583.1 hypothetical protein [Serratia sp. C2(1)]
MEMMRLAGLLSVLTLTNFPGAGLFQPPKALFSAFTPFWRAMDEVAARGKARIDNRPSFRQAVAQRRCGLAVFLMNDFPC